CAALSRSQATVARPETSEMVLVRTGQCPMLVNGTEMERAVVHEGDVVEFGFQVGLLCAERPSRLAPSPVPLHDFGEPDVDGLVGESPAAWELRNKIAFAGPRPGHA